MFRLIISFLLIIGFTADVFGRAADNPAIVLAAAKTKYQQTRMTLGKQLESGFADAIKAIAATGDLNAVKQVITERDAFLKDGTLPTSAGMQTAVTAYQTELTKARTELAGSYKTAVQELTKQLKFDAATAIQAELKAFEQDGTVTIPESPTANVDPLRVPADRAREAYQAELKRMRQEFDEVVATRIKDVAATGDLEAVKTLQSFRENFQQTGDTDTSTDPAIRAASREYAAAARAAERTLTKEYQAAIAVAVREKNLELARLLTIELDGGFDEDGPRWTILFRSNQPSLWNTESNDDNGYAIPVEQAATDVKYLRFRRLDKKAAVYLAIAKDDLLKMSEDGDWGWNGTGKLDWKGHHLGIYKVSSLVKFPAPNQLKGAVAVANKGFDTFYGYGFGHFLKLDSGQGFSWAGRNIRPTILEIAVTSGELTAAERKLLLK